MDFNGKKVLVAFFSRKGMNHVNGEVKDLKIGNTAIVAHRIDSELDAETFEIIAKKKYAKDYNDCVKEAIEEYRAKTRPELVGDIEITDFDIIFLGYPNWCGTMPMPVYTFLDTHDFSNKIVIPFCTNEGSGIGSSVEDIKKSIPSADVRNGLSIKGSEVSKATNEILAWLENL